MEQRRPLPLLPLAQPAPKRILQDTTGNVQNSALDILRSRFLKQGRSHGESVGRQPPAPSQPSRTSISARLEQRRRRRAAAANAYSSIWDSVEYQQYRARQKRDGAQNRDPVWPDNVEDSFKAALALIPPIGRRKLPKNGKPRGRNELIVDYIMMKNPATKDITRKQVSSHIQVLRSLMKMNAAFMKLVTPMDTSDKRPFYMSPQLRTFLAGGDPDIPASPGQTSEPSVADGSLPMLGDALTSISNAAKAIFRPVNFVMWVQPPDQDRGRDPRLHTYTSLSESSALPPMPLESLYNWRTAFPHLSTLHHAGAVDCEITLLESSLNIPHSTSPLTGWVLGTQLEVLVTSTLAHHRWHCVTHMYCPKKEPRRVEREVQQADLGPDGTGKLHLYFAPNFWAETFVDMAEERRKLCERHEYDVAEERVLSHVRNISVVQELFATCEEERVIRKRMGVLLWTFKGTNSSGSEARTTWRNLIPPPSRILTNSPAPPPPFADSLGDTLWDQNATPTLIPEHYYETPFQSQEFSAQQMSPRGAMAASPSQVDVSSFCTGPLLRENRHPQELQEDFYYGHAGAPEQQQYASVHATDSFKMHQDEGYHTQQWHEYMPPEMAHPGFDHHQAFIDQVGVDPRPDESTNLHFA
ncbi:MAG: hypothetical protein M1833_003618 [Piccolia ochrophora]|nr:MAG: hypothetical protein M1833_003618 [Piccolia ochrophora]